VVAGLQTQERGGVPEHHRGLLVEGEEDTLAGGDLEEVGVVPLELAAAAPARAAAKKKAAVDRDVDSFLAGLVPRKTKKVAKTKKMMPKMPKKAAPVKKVVKAAAAPKKRAHVVKMAIARLAQKTQEALHAAKPKMPKKSAIAKASSPAGRQKYRARKIEATTSVPSGAPNFAFVFAPLPAHRVVVRTASAASSPHIHCIVFP